MSGSHHHYKKRKHAVDSLKETSGVFWYARENGNQAPSSDQEQLIKALFGYVVRAGLRIRLFTDGTFTTLAPM